MSHKKLLAALGGMALAGAAWVFFFSHRSELPRARRETESGYVDPAACAGCHQEIARTYRLTGMGRSLYRPSAGNTVEDYNTHNTLYHRASGLSYTMLGRDGKWYQRRHQLGFAGKQTNIVEKQVDFVVGSGNHARTYLHRTAEGKLVELPVSWYAEKGGYWAMSPGYDRPSQQDFRRLIPYDCLFCHNGYPAQQPDPSLTGYEPIFSGQIPEGIDCQRCHGPGRAHIEAAGSGRAAADAIRQAIVNPARLSRERQLEVCMQCHLETTSRQLPNSIRRFDRAPFSYRPGEPLENYSVYFDRAPGAGHDDDFEIAHAAYRLRKSACFQASSMTCTTCHNPHQVLRGKEAIEHYVAVCRGCHPAAHASGIPAAANCLDCHMPKRRADDAVHVVMTDHYIQRRRPGRDLLAPLQETDDPERNTYRGEVTLYYPQQLPSTPENELYGAVAQLEHGSNLQAGIPRLQQAIEKHAPNRPEFYFELGEAYSKAGNKNEAIHWYEEALRRRPDFRPALKELVVALFATGGLARATELMEKAVATPPLDAGILTNLGNAYLQQGKLDEARQALERALSVDPDVPDACNLLGLVWAQKGDRTAAESRFRDAIRLQPDLAPAHYNLANLLAGAGDLAQAEYHFKRAIAANAAYVDAHRGYGLLLVLTRSYDKALVEMQEAVRLDPSSAQAHSDLADVLAVKGRLDGAAEEYRAALRLKPQLAEANYGLGRVSAVQGKSAEAAAQFRLAIQWNPNYYEAHLALGLILAREGNAAEARAHEEKAAESSDPDLRQAALAALKALR